MSSAVLHPFHAARQRSNEPAPSALTSLATGICRIALHHGEIDCILTKLDRRQRRAFTKTDSSQTGYATRAHEGSLPHKERTVG